MDTYYFLTQNRVWRELVFPVVLLATLASGCGLIFGGDQRVDNRSHAYKHVPLDREFRHQWYLIAPEQAGPPEDSGDVAYEHRKSGSIISLNSVCRESRDASLDDLSRLLLLGLDTTSPPESVEVELDGERALQTTVAARMRKAGKNPAHTEAPVQIRAIVMRKGGCTFDFMLIAPPDSFSTQLSAFDRFLKGFHAD